MGKKQHQKDKLWLTTTEMNESYGGKKISRIKDSATAKFRRLPFNYCCISLQPFEVPVCCPDGWMFDLMSIIPFLKKYNVHPVTGKPFDSKQLVKLHFAKNQDGKYHCPILYKVFTETSHIVAVRTSGNVFSFEAVDTLNIKPRNYRDLINDKVFKKEDIITLQDPKHLEKFNMENFHHLKQKMSNAGKSSDSTLKVVAPEARHALAKLAKEYKPPSDSSLFKSQPQHKFLAPSTDKLNKAIYSTGKVAASLTSTAMNIETQQESAKIEDNEIRFKRLHKAKKKGYVRLVTNLGPLNLELHCDQVAKTCENFILLCKKNYYRGTIFHRLIRNFIVQGGDPTGSGAGGESV